MSLPENYYLWQLRLKKPLVRYLRKTLIPKSLIRYTFEKYPFLSQFKGLQKITLSMKSFIAHTVNSLYLEHSLFQTYREFEAREPSLWKIFKNWYILYITYLFLKIPGNKITIAVFTNPSLPELKIWFKQMKAFFYSEGL